MAEAFLFTFMYVNSWHWQRCSDIHTAWFRNGIYLSFRIRIRNPRDPTELYNDFEKICLVLEKHHQHNWFFKNKFLISFSSTLPVIKNKKDIIFLQNVAF
jgi:hypothetical protein